MTSLVVVLHFINAAETFKPVPLLTIAQAKELMPHGLGAANDIPADSLVHFPHASPGDFAVQIAGNSMMPWYPPGTQLLVSRETKPQTGNRVIAMLADYAEPLFKIYIDLGGRKRDLTRERVVRLVERLTPDNVERFKRRLLAKFRM